MSAPNPITQKGILKSYEFTQDGKKYTIQSVQNLNNAVFTIKDKNKINEIFNLEITFEDIKKKNSSLEIYKNIEEFINSLEQFISNKNISIKENNNGLILDLYLFNIMNGNKEKVSFEFNKSENYDKDEIIKSLCLKVNNLEEKYNKLNEKYEKIIYFVGTIINFRFQWENHNNCELSNNNKRLRKIKDEGWNTNVKGNKILRKNSMNIFKIKVNNIHKDKNGLYFGIARSSFNFSSSPYDEEWNISCNNTINNSKFKSFKYSEINKNNIVTFIVDLNDGTLEVRKNDDSL